MSESPSDTDPNAVVEAPPSAWSDLWRTEDWWSVWLGAVLLLGCGAGVWFNRPADFDTRLARLARLKSASGTDAGAAEERKRLEADLKKSLARPFQTWVVKLERWESSPWDAFAPAGKPAIWGGLCLLCLVWLSLFGGGQQALGGSYVRFAPALVVVFALAVLAQLLAAHAVIRWANLEYPLWALLVGLIVSHTIGTPQGLLPAVRTEFYIKTGLVLLGGEVLLGELARLGLPGVCISWIVTPIVFVGTYVFGQSVLRMPSKTLNLVISADMSVCGVSAAIATGAACRAKKEEISLAIGISLLFTVVMMVVQPKLIQWCGIDPIIGAAWIGGTIDATGAVAAAGAVLGQQGLFVASTVKMIQNILIGVVAFGVAVYWASFEEQDPQAPRPSAWEIWYRMPKFILGFVLASAGASWLYAQGPEGRYVVDAVTGGATKTLREWCFTLAFVSIGLETNFHELVRYLRGGKAVTLYVVGQTFNLLATGLMAWWMFGVVFRDVASRLAAP